MITTNVVVGEIAAEYVDEAVSGGIPIAERPQAKLMLEHAKTGQFQGMMGHCFHLK